MLPKVFPLKKNTHKSVKCVQQAKQSSSKVKAKSKQRQWAKHSIACMNSCLDTLWGWFPGKQV
jgi:hypothetical protein